MRASVPRLVHVNEYPRELCRPRLAEIQSHRGGGFRRRAHRAGEQPGRERPHLRNADPGPRFGHGVAHVPAACLRSCDVCARQCREQSSQDPIANAGDNSPRDFAVDRSLQSRGDVVVDLAPHLSPGCAEITPPSRCGFSCGARRASTLSACAPTVRSARPAGVDTACAPLAFGIYAMVEV